ncbi:MAG: hypothetical protein ABR570_00265 [Burkholderiales bacterium]
MIDVINHERGADAKMRPPRAYCNYLLDEPLAASLPLDEGAAPVLAPLEPVVSELEEPEDGVSLVPPAAAPYCFTQSLRSVPVMPTH